MRLLNADAAIAAGVIGSREPDSPITVTNSALVGSKMSPCIAEHESAGLDCGSTSRVQRRRPLSRFEVPSTDVSVGIQTILLMEGSAYALDCLAICRLLVCSRTAVVAHQ